jgi:PEP-CTERM/exosortase A-associated glycosyltransferase
MSTGRPEMRILHVFDHSIPLHSGYTFRSRAILRHQHALGWETAHLTSPRHTRDGPPVETVDGLTFHRTPKPWLNDVPGLGELALMRATAQRLCALVPEIRPDIIHAHSPVLNAIPALKAGRRFNLPVVYEVRAFWEDAAVSHGNGRANGPRYALTRWLETRALKRADAVTTICEGLRGDIIARGIPADKVTVIPNAVDTDDFTGGGDPDPALAAELGLAGRTVIGFIGSFYGYEGLHLLLAAMPEILAKAPDTCLLLVGGGPEDDRLRAQAADLDLGGSVIFTGRVPHTDVQRYYDLVDLFVYPRINIRLTDLVTPLKPLEAMAQNKIVVASNIGGHRELIEDGITGTLFRPDDPTDLARTVLDVTAHRDGWPAQRQRARAYVETERNWAASVARYKPVYERLVKKSG